MGPPVSHTGAAAGRREHRDRKAFLDEARAGLSRRPPSIPSRWFYDARGSRLFQWITNLPGYYLTRVEREILADRAADAAAPFAGRPCAVVDLGAGDGHKTAPLLRALAAVVPALAYAPVDVSRAALDEACARAAAAVPGVAARPVQASWTAALRRLGRSSPDEARLLLFLGSSIGNLEHAEAAALLGGLRRAMRPGDHLLVGFDLVKPLEVLLAAYDDPQGVTRAFNLNLLARLNRELGADVDVAAFRHVATWDPVRPAMESWLEPVRDLVIHLGGRAFHLARGERIRTEISCKYTSDRIDHFAAGAGFEEVVRFGDPRGWFVDALWRVPA